MRNIATTHILDKIAEAFGEICYEVPVGFKYISAKMQEKDAIIGGESSGGLTVRGHIRGKDGIYAASLMLEMLALTGKSLSEVIEEMEEQFGKTAITEQNYHFPAERKAELQKILYEDKLLPDFGKTIDISTRCGDDSDCNPASSAGILGVMYGYSAIPEEWKGGIAQIADMAFPYTTLSLNKICDLNKQLVGELALRNGGRFEDGVYHFISQKPETVRYEKSFEGIRPVEKRVLKKNFTDELTLEFDGNSIVVEGSVQMVNESDRDYRAEISAYLDGELVEEFVMPIDYLKRRYEVFSKYCFESGHHSLRFVLNNPDPAFSIRAQEMVVYDKED